MLLKGRVMSGFTNYLAQSNLVMRLGFGRHTAEEIKKNRSRAKRGIEEIVSLRKQIHQLPNLNLNRILKPAWKRLIALEC